MSRQALGRQQTGGGCARARCAGAVFAAALAVLPALPAAAEEPVTPETPSRNLFGMTGLIDTPTAEMQPDGQLGFTTSYFSGYLRNTATFQILPGIEGAFRYSVLEEMLGTQGETLFDRSFDIKLRLVDESPRWPAVAVGLQDFLGTGVYSGEYIVATKRLFGGDLKVTGGLGWGRFAGVSGVTNPLCKGFDRLCGREQDPGLGGTVDIDTFFSGEEMGVFGGIEWRTPVEGLTFKAEYSDDDYDTEERLGDFERKLPLNFGLEYQVTKGIQLGAYYMYGTDFGLRLSLSGNPFRPGNPADAEPAPRPVLPRPEPAPEILAQIFGDVRELTGAEPTKVAFAETGVTDVEVATVEGDVRWATAVLPASADYVCPDDAARAIDAEFGVVDAVTFRHADGRLVCTVALRPAGERLIRRTARAVTAYPTDWHADEARRREAVEAFTAELDPERIGLYGIELMPERVTVYIENLRYREMPRAIGRTARALAATMPPSVALFEIVPVEGSLPTATVAIERAALEDQVGRPDAAWKSWVSAEVTDAPPPDWSEVEGVLEQYPRTDWSINPTMPLYLFDPDQPVGADLAVNAVGSVEFLPGLKLSGSVQKRIIGTLDDIERESDSALPRVRSDVGKYLSRGDPGITRLSLDYVTKLDEAIYGRVSAGLFEMMFGGVGAEILWKPVDQDWGVGADINWVRQREFEQLFGFRDYDVVTGHVSFYWDTGFHGMNVQVDAGRYLAKDWGGTFTLKRRFQNGWELGGFFTLTDVPFDEFGEGSFDKGLFLNIPLSWFLPLETRGSYSTVIRPLTRDGGQRVVRTEPLYPRVADMDRGGLGTTWGGFWE